MKGLPEGRPYLDRGDTVFLRTCQPSNFPREFACLVLATDSTRVAILPPEVPSCFSRSPCSAPCLRIPTEPVGIAFVNKRHPSCSHYFHALRPSTAKDMLGLGLRTALLQFMAELVGAASPAQQPPPRPLPGGARPAII